MRRSYVVYKIFALALHLPEESSPSMKMVCDLVENGMLVCLQGSKLSDRLLSKPTSLIQFIKSFDSCGCGAVGRKMPCCEFKKGCTLINRRIDQWMRYIMQSVYRDRIALSCITLPLLHSHPCILLPLFPYPVVLFTRSSLWLFYMLMVAAI